MAPESETSEDKFNFSFARAQETKRDIELQLDAYETRLDKIIRKVQLNEAPIVQMILTVSHDPDELERLGRALTRVAEIIKPIDELRAQKTMIELAEQNKNSFMGMFGDFSTEVDGFLTTIDKSGDTE